MTKTNYKYQAFSLIELIIVISIIAIIAGITYPSYYKYIMESRRSEALTTLVSTQNKLEQFYLQNNVYPNSLTALLSPPPVSEAAAISANLNYYYTYNQSGTGYTLSAVPASSSQKNDKACPVFTVDNLGNKGPSTCWPH